MCCKIVDTYSKNQTNKQTETKPTLRSGAMCTQEKELFSPLVHIDIVRSLHLNTLRDIETNQIYNVVHFLIDRILLSSK